MAFMPELFFRRRAGRTCLGKGAWEDRNRNCRKILPVTDALPPEFQLPNKARNRGRVVLALQDPNQFAVEEKVRVTGCIVNNCDTGVMECG